MAFHEERNYGSVVLHFFWYFLNVLLYILLGGLYFYADTPRPDLVCL